MTIELLKGARVHAYNDCWPRGVKVHKVRVIENAIRRRGGGYTWTDPIDGRERWVKTDDQARVVEET